MSLTVQDLVRITRKLKGVQLDQLQSLIDGSDDPDDYNPNALRQIENALAELEPYIDEGVFLDTICHSERMRGVCE